MLERDSAVMAEMRKHKYKRKYVRTNIHMKDAQIRPALLQSRVANKCTRVHFVRHLRQATRTPV